MEHDAPWVAQLTQTDLARLSLARAFVMNPEYLVMHMPMVLFTDSESGDMMRLLADFVAQKGLQVPASERIYRRPKTVFVSSSSTDRTKGADAVFHLEAGKLTESVPRETETPRS